MSIPLLHFIFKAIDSRCVFRLLQQTPIHSADSSKEGAGDKTAQAAEKSLPYAAGTQLRKKLLLGFGRHVVVFNNINTRR